MMQLLQAEELQLNISQSVKNRFKKVLLLTFVLDADANPSNLISCFSKNKGIKEKRFLYFQRGVYFKQKPLVS